MDSVIVRKYKNPRKMDDEERMAHLKNLEKNKNRRYYVRCVIKNKIKDLEDKLINEYKNENYDVLDEIIDKIENLKIQEVKLNEAMD